MNSNTCMYLDIRWHLKNDSRKINNEGKKTFNGAIFNNSILKYDIYYNSNN